MQAAKAERMPVNQLECSDGHGGLRKGDDTVVRGDKARRIPQVGRKNAGGGLTVVVVVVVVAVVVVCTRGRT